MKKIFGSKLITNISLVFPLVGVGIGLAIACLIASLFGESPILFLKVLFSSFLNSKFDMGLTLFYMSIFIFSALAFSVPFKTGLFHIGVEGKIILSATIITAMTLFFENTILANFTTVFIIGFFFLAMLGWLIVYLKIFRNSHEVISAILLNSIIFSFSNWLILKKFQNPDSQNPESRLIPTASQFLTNDFIKNYFDQSPVSLFFVLSIFVCLLMHFFERRLSFFQIIYSFGRNDIAAEQLGFSKAKFYFFAFCFSSFFALLAAVTEIFGNSLQFRIGFSPLYGFLGITVALLARGNSIGIIFSSFLIAVLHKGASDFDIESQFLNREFSKILQAIIILVTLAVVFILNRLAIRVRMVKKDL